MEIDADMAASSRPRNGLAEKLAQACPECMRRLEDCKCARPGRVVYLPPGAKVLTVGFDEMLYVPPENLEQPSVFDNGWYLTAALLTALAAGVVIGYAARHLFA